MIGKLIFYITFKYCSNLKLGCAYFLFKYLDKYVDQGVIDIKELLGEKGK